MPNPELDRRTSDTAPSAATLAKGRVIHTMVLGLPVLFLIHAFFPSVFMTWAVCVWSILLFFIHLPLIRGFSKIISVCLLAFGTLLLWTSHVSYDQWVLSFSQNANLLSLFLLVPLIGIPLRLGGYLQAMKSPRD